MKIFKSLLNTSYQSYSRRSFCCINNVYPYKFGNNTLIYDIKVDHNDIIHDIIKDRIIFSYKNFVTALKEKDSNYIEKNCEKGFAKYIKREISHMLSDLIIKKDEDIEEKFYIKSMEVETHYHITNDRDINAKNKNKNNFSLFLFLHDKFTMKMVNLFEKYISDFKKLHFFYKINKETSVIRIKINLKTNFILSKTKSLLTPMEFEDHSLIIEKKGDLSTIISLIQLYKTIPNTLKIKDDSQFYIADFDNCMNENPLVKQD